MSVERWILDAECPCCGCEAELDLTEHIREILNESAPPKVKIAPVQMSEAIDYIFTRLVQVGYAPSSAEIFEILMFFGEFMDKRAREYGQEFDHYD